MSFFDLIYSQEAIAVQTNSTLGKRLDKLFTECMDMRDSVDITTMSGGELAKLNKKIADHIKKHLGTIAEEEIGLKIVEWNINTDYVPKNNIAINYLTLFDTEAVYDQECRMQGYGGFFDQKDLTSSIQSRIQKVIEIAKTYDTKTGKLKGRVWPIKLYLDMTVFFMLDLKYPDKKLTPREITAIVLHEFGHASIFLERVGTAYFLAKSVDDNINKWISDRKNNSIQDINKFILKALDPLLTYVESKKLNDKDFTSKVAQARSILNTLATITSFLCAKEEEVSVSFDKKCVDQEYAQRLSGASIVKSAATILRGIISVLLAILGRMIVQLFISPIFTYLNAEIAGHSNTKTSDIKFTLHNTYMLEQMADQFAVRHGYGAEIASGLDKIFLVDSVNQCTAIAVLKRVEDQINHHGSGYYGYEMNHARIRRILQSTIGLLKDLTLPVSFRNQQLDNIKKTFAILDKYGTDIYNRSKWDIPLNILLSLTTIDEILRICTSGKLTSEYETHLNKIEDLINNTMYAHSAGLKRMVEDIKKA